MPIGPDKADCGNLADFRKCPLLGDQPLFLPGTLERFFAFSHPLY
jgi:hypothetical protein